MKFSLHGVGGAIGLVARFEWTVGTLNWQVSAFLTAGAKKTGASGGEVV